MKVLYLNFFTLCFAYDMRMVKADDGICRPLIMSEAELLNSL